MIHWLVRSLADLPADDAWLSVEERARLSEMRVEKRAADFRLGRFTAHEVLRLACGEGPWSVRARDDGSPAAFRDGVESPCTLSISHSGGVAMAAVSTAGLPLGCDVEHIEPRDGALAEQFFTDAERVRIAEAPDRDTAVTLVWSIKESALKVLRVGLRADTRSVEVGWAGARAWARTNDVLLEGFCHVEGERVLSLLLGPAIDD